MTIKERIQEDIKEAMRNREQARLECLRMAKGALTLKEKEAGTELSDEEVVRVLRGEVRKRQDTIDLLRKLAKHEEANLVVIEIRTLEGYLPQQLSEEQLEAKARAYAAEHPEINNAGRLTGALKKELGDLADGRMLAEVAKRVIPG